MQKPGNELQLSLTDIVADTCIKESAGISRKTKSRLAALTLSALFLSVSGHAPASAQCSQQTLDLVKKGLNWCQEQCAQQSDSSRQNAQNNPNGLYCSASNFIRQSIAQKNLPGVRDALIGCIGAPDIFYAANDCAWNRPKDFIAATLEVFGADGTRSAKAGKSGGSKTKDNNAKAKNAQAGTSNDNNNLSRGGDNNGNMLNIAPGAKIAAGGAGGINGGKDTNNAGDSVMASKMPSGSGKVSGSGTMSNTMTFAGASVGASANSGTLSANVALPQKRDALISSSSDGAGGMRYRFRQKMTAQAKDPRKLETRIVVPATGNIKNMQLRYFRDGERTWLVSPDNVSISQDGQQTIIAISAWDRLKKNVGAYRYQVEAEIQISN